MPTKTSNTQIIILGFFIFFSILGVILFAGFFGSDQKSQQGDEVIELWGVLPSDIWLNVFKDSETDDPGRMKIRYTYKSLDTIEKDYDNSIINKTPPDALLIPESLLVRNENKFSLIPWQSFPQRDFKDLFVDGGEIFTTKEGFYAFPLLIDPLVTYWNRDIFSTNGIARAPKDWDEVSQILPKITKIADNKEIQRSLLALGSFDNIGNAKDIILSLISQAGSRMIERGENTLKNNVLISKLEVNEDEGESQDGEIGNNPVSLSLNFFLQFSNPHNPMYSWNSSRGDSLSLFLKQDLATHFGFGSQFKEIISKNPNLNVDIAPFPQSESADNKAVSGRIYGLFITRDSTKKQSVFNQFKELISVDIMKNLATFFDMAPSRRDIIFSSVPEDAKDTTIWNSALYTKGWLDPDPNITKQMIEDMIKSSGTGEQSIYGASLIFSREIDELLKNK